MTKGKFTFSPISSLIQKKTVIFLDVRALGGLTSVN
jgi:hypothetical protein